MNAGQSGNSPCWDRNLSTAIKSFIVSYAFFGVILMDSSFIFTCCMICSLTVCVCARACAWICVRQYAFYLFTVFVLA